MLIVKYKNKPDTDVLKAIAITNNTTLSNGHIVTLEDTTAKKTIGYASYQVQGNKLTINEINILPGKNKPLSIELIFNHIKHIESDIRTYNYRGRYSKFLGFKGGELKLVINNSTVTTNDKLKTRKEKLDGVDYLVAPVVMVREQVLNGEFLPADEIEKSTIGWNGRPVVVYHPKDNAGRDTIANDPEVIPKYEVGRVYNAEYDPKSTKLKAEVWIDVSRAKRKNDDTKMALDMIQNSEHLEVSTGYIVNERIEEDGEFDGVAYNAIQRDILPDHLALLPQEIGACSWQDGAGVRNNTSKVKDFLKRLVNNLTTKGSINSQLQSVLKEEYSDFAWIQDLIHDEETGSDFVVFNTNEKYENGNFIEPGKTYAVDYSFNEEGKAVLGETINEVEPIQQYVTKNKKQEETELNKKEMLVRDVIANSKGKFQRKDKATLLSCNTSALVSMLPKEKRKTYTTNKTAKGSKNKLITNAFRGRKFRTNEGEEMLVEELIAMEPTDVVATVETITDVAELEAVATVLEDVIQVAEVVEAVGSDLEANEEFTQTVDEVIISAEEVLEVVEAAIEEMGGTTPEEDPAAEPAANVDVTDVFNPEEETEEALVSALETASSKRRRLRRNARNKKTEPKKANKTGMSLNEYIDSIPDPEAREFIKNGVAESKRHRANLLTSLTGNKNCQFSEKELKAMETNQLEKLATMIGTAGKRSHATNSVDYSIRGLQTNDNKNNNGCVPMTKNIFKKGGNN